MNAFQSWKSGAFKRGHRSCRPLADAGIALNVGSADIWSMIGRPKVQSLGVAQLTIPAPSDASCLGGRAD
jgi:hypothetical protein